MARTIVHGTYAGAVAGCDCDQCTNAHLTYRRTRRRRIAYGTWNPWGDVDAVRAHLNHLIASGLGPYRIADATGRSGSHIKSLAEGRITRVTSGVAEQILALTPIAVTPTYVPADGTRRRLQALAVLGWGVTAIHKESGVGRAVLHGVRGGSRRMVEPATRDRVAAVYDRWSMSQAPQSQPAARARTDARKHGWLPPLAWDDDLIDLPDADLDAELRRRAEEMSQAEVSRCHWARRQGDRSPLIVAGAQEYQRRRKAREKARRGVAA